MPQDPYVLESYCPGKINNTYNNNGLIVYRFRTLFVVTIQLSMLNRILNQYLQNKGRLRFGWVEAEHDSDSAVIKPSGSMSHGLKSKQFILHGFCTVETGTC